MAQLRVLVDTKDFKVVEYLCGCGCWVNFGAKPRVVDRQLEDPRCRRCIESMGSPRALQGDDAPLVRSASSRGSAT